jgi:ParB family chromosome partitioning protein
VAGWAVYPEREPARAARALAEQVERDGGHVLALYQEPVGEHWQLFCLLPRERVSASPYQRDLSPAHVKRLTEAIRKLDRFLDPVVAVSPRAGVYWTPNGNHRRAALEKLKVAYIPAILVAEPEVGYQILPLNTEKAHNLREKSLEVVRMYRALAEEAPGSSEAEWAFQFESAHFITLGFLYEQDKRFAGGAFAPLLRRVDTFLGVSLRRGLEERAGRADLVREADRALSAVVAKLKRRGVQHPYVKPYVLSRTTPLTRARKTLPTFEQTFRRLRENLETFDVSRIRYEDIQRAAVAMAPPLSE